MGTKPESKVLTEEELYEDIIETYVDVDYEVVEAEDDEEDEDDYYDDCEYDEYLENGAHGPNQQGAATRVTSFQPKTYEKFSSRVNMGQYRLPGRAGNELKESEQRKENERFRLKDKADRATVEHVFDARTRHILHNMINNHHLEYVNGCFSTGKEANVYHATAQDGTFRAVKIFQTVNPQFKRRRQYVEGDFRFPQNTTKTTSCKFIKDWADKEYRNLKRIREGGINCPIAYENKANIIVMSLIGNGSVPAPALKDIMLSNSESRAAYLDVVIAMWRLYHRCKLVHADLSEYNMLYNEGEVYIIDVGQAVEREHPNSIQLLGMDCHNITKYFRKQHVACMTTIELLTFVIAPEINEENMASTLDELSKLAGERDFMTAEQQQQEATFTKLLTTNKFKSDVNKLRSGDNTKATFTEQLMNLISGDIESENKAALEENNINIANLTLNKSHRNSESDTDSDNDSDESKKKSNFVNTARPKDESLEDKKARKQAVKDAKAEKRETKVKKHVKKRAEKIKRK